MLRSETQKPFVKQSDRAWLEGHLGTPEGEPMQSSLKRWTIATAAGLALVAWALPAESQVPTAPTISATQDSGYVRYTYVLQPGMTGLTIQEAGDPNFLSGLSSIGAPVTQTTYGFPHACVSFYYRAVARNAYGSGPWSAAQRSDCAGS